jgi:site-specific recombinase
LPREIRAQADPDVDCVAVGVVATWHARVRAEAAEANDVVIARACDVIVVLRRQQVRHGRSVEVVHVVRRLVAPLDDVLCRVPVDKAEGERHVIRAIRELVVACQWRTSMPRVCSGAT